MTVRNFKREAIGICDRCKCKRPLQMLTKDGNTPGLRVCSDDKGCWDQLDPYRKPRKRERPVSLKYTRPDLSLTDSITLIGTENDEYVITQDGNDINKEPL